MTSCERSDSGDESVWNDEKNERLCVLRSLNDDDASSSSSSYDCDYE